MNIEILLKEKIIDVLCSLDERAQGIIINPSELIFEENVKMNCYYCGKYNVSWRCPPKLPDVNFEKMMSEFEYGMFIVMKFDIDNNNYNSVRNESSITLHKLILSLEKWFWEHNNSNCLSFIGGSCKLCKNGCGKEKCNNPYMSRSPIEATGINVIKSIKKCGINITFPPDKYIMRIGLILWQE